MQSPKTPCGGVYFQHAQNKRRGLAFVHRVRKRSGDAVTKLWGHLERSARVVGAPCGRCVHAVKTPCKSCI